MVVRSEAEPRAKLAVRSLVGIDEVAAADWDRCAGPDDPLVSHAFLSCLEQSGSAQADTGWQPQHLVVEDGCGKVVGAAPLYLKAHSYGEYVFDWGWADAYQRVGMAYYPKLQCSVPFTPVTGPRLLVLPGGDEETIRKLLVAAMVEVARRAELSSVHLTFLTEPDSLACRELSLLGRVGVQFHWHNRGYDSFEQFLASLIARKRKAINRERRLAAESGLRLRTLRGEQIEPRHWEALYGFYRDTCDHKWGSAYLKLEFFQQLGSVLPANTVLMVAEQDDEPVAGALHLLGNKALYGRYWGTSIDARWLHFELCYYRAIDFAIEMGLERVEAGAQGPHKLQRGYLPVRTYSAHWIRHPAFRDAIGRALEAEHREVDWEIELLREQSPYREDRRDAREPRRLVRRRAMHAR